MLLFTAEGWSAQPYFLTLVLTQRLEHLRASLKIVVVGSNPAGYWTSLSSLSVSFSLYLCLSLCLSGVSISKSLAEVHLKNEC